MGVILILEEETVHRTPFRIAAIWDPIWFTRSMLFTRVMAGGNFGLVLNVTR